MPGQAFPRPFPEHKRHNLDSLIERHGLAADARHRALADARLIHQFWQRVNTAPGAAAVEAAVRQQNARPSLPAYLDAGIVDELPEGPGVYLFYGENALPLYVGKAKDIKKRALSHFAADHRSARRWTWPAGPAHRLDRNCRRSRRPATGSRPGQGIAPEL